MSALRLGAVGLSLIAVCYGFARFAYGLFLPAFDERFGLGGAMAGAIASSSYLAYCVAIVAATAATPRWGARTVAVLAGVAAAVGTATIAAAPNVIVLAIGVVIAGSSTGLASPPLAHAVARHVTADRVDRVQTVVNSGTGLGVMVSGPIALASGADWAMAWYVFAATAVVVTVWVALTIPPNSGQAERRALVPTPVLAAGSLPLFVASAMMGAGSAAIWTFGRDVAVGGGLSPTASTVMWIVLGAAGLLGALTGDLASRAGLARAWTAAMLVLAAATAVFGAVGGPSLIATAAVFGAVYLALTGLVLLWGIRVYPDHPAFGVGAPFLLIAAGQALGSPAIGALSDGFTVPVAFGAAALTLVIGAAIRPTTS
ncbi:YbfB/YjiJ family MFS transporter [Mycobacterium deserti]|uniref:YbfB/YjiJ family MFS transporter n=1 Tax=Mycobacterium deserti TaxID=2978347 RepID=A0ABT2MAB1_9MYCO|nr:YbfB/YjiJ family MFS transporter [Mycobacterium deserti]MCT7657946.1 YbfB/YjiJ family MFS transporter [Mycobacterium deserti]